LERYLDNRGEDADIRGVYKGLASLSKEGQFDMGSFDEDSKE
jgi:RNA polymerase sporulation-specific sigma factor